MALSATQKAQIHRLGGYSERDSDVLNSPAHQIRARLDGLSAEFETEVGLLLGTTADAATAGTILGIEAALVAQRGRRKAAALGEITLNLAEMEQLRQEGSAKLGQLFSLLGLAVLTNPFYPSRGASGGGGLCLPSL